MWLLFSNNYCGIKLFENVKINTPVIKTATEMIYLVSWHLLLTQQVTCQKYRQFQKNTKRRYKNKVKRHTNKRKGIKYTVRP